MIGVLEKLSQEERVVLRETSRDGLGERPHFRDETSARQTVQDVRIALTGHEGVEHSAARNTHDVADHVRQFDIGRLKQLVNPD